MKKIIILSFIFLGVLGFTAEVRADYSPEACIEAEGENVSNNGYNFGCRFGNYGFELEEYTCLNSLVPDIYTSDESTWLNSCREGFNDGEEILLRNIDKFKNELDPPYNDLDIEDIYNVCNNYGGANNSKVAGCLKGYFIFVNNPKDIPHTNNGITSSSDFCLNSEYNLFTSDSGDIALNNGCLAGANRAATYYYKNLPGYPMPGDSVRALAADKDNCGLVSSASDELRAAYEGAYLLGCARQDSYNIPLIGTCKDGADSSLDPNVRPRVGFSFENDIGNKITSYGNGYTDGCLLSYNLEIIEDDAELLPPPTGGGLVPDCKPYLPPSDPRSCGLPEAVELINTIITELQKYSFILAGIFILYGGFLIMTSGGSTDRVSKGKSAIQIAVVGIVIVLVAVLIVKGVFQLLGVRNVDFIPTGADESVL
ncbi:MAG: hypothetical protein COU06_00180 [Candidatus Harrisonbacteria bacterium CG10_big_fil_rev_8_21_14_0_10_38_8]|uniref:Uncharacterized protein n=1 Tax=Candidatus Harrisonbacteria bacterium CG10_big_fil_rev_8_21_14_0_10_38_8 TaxID=1974582 RepID=A0A2M6WKQ5_9BACT|nr:MAG: hypothetical protein COU06_00180 [Candidatus Harrisonbacteria bacterium CG10_big_fil_rev_8_21_14_0_10_38_8]